METQLVSQCYFNFKVLKQQALKIEVSKISIFEDKLAEIFFQDEIFVTAFSSAFRNSFRLLELLKGL